MEQGEAWVNADLLGMLPEIGYTVTDSLGNTWRNGHNHGASIAGVGSVIEKFDPNGNYVGWMGLTLEDY